MQCTLKVLYFFKFFKKSFMDKICFFLEENTLVLNAKSVSNKYELGTAVGFPTLQIFVFFYNCWYKTLNPYYPILMPFLTSNPHPSLKNQFTQHKSPSTPPILLQPKKNNNKLQYHYTKPQRQTFPTVGVNSSVHVVMQSHYCTNEGRFLQNPINCCSSHASVAGQSVLKGNGLLGNRCTQYNC